MERKRLRKSHLVLTVNLTEDLHTETKANREFGENQYSQNP